MLFYGLILKIKGFFGVFKWIKQVLHAIPSLSHTHTHTHTYIVYVRIDFKKCDWVVFFFLTFLGLFLFILFIYLWLCWVFISVWGLSLVAASGGHSSSRCAGLSLSRPLLLRSTGSRRAGSAIMAHGPSRSVACGIFPDQGSNPCPLHWQADSQPLRHQGSPWLSFKVYNIILVEETDEVTYLACNSKG